MPSPRSPPWRQRHCVHKWLLSHESPTQCEQYRLDLLLIPRLTYEMLSLMRSTVTPSVVSARSAIHHASRKRGRPSRLHGTSAPVAAASLIRSLHGAAATPPGLVLTTWLKTYSLEGTLEYSEK